MIDYEYFWKVRLKKLKYQNSVKIDHQTPSGHIFICGCNMDDMRIIWIASDKRRKMFLIDVFEEVNNG